MRLGRTRRATALAAAVIGGLLGPQAPAAPAAPDGPAAQSSTAPDRTG
ncbi:hyaluronoglucosaminidase, partial [Streptomyces sp. BpilaLS-43]